MDKVTDSEAVDIIKLEKAKANQFQIAMEQMARRIAKQEIGKYHVAVQIVAVTSSIKECNTLLKGDRDFMIPSGLDDNGRKSFVETRKIRIKDNEKALSYYTKTLKSLNEDQEKVGKF